MSKTIKKEIKKTPVYNLKISTEQAFKIGKDLHDGLKKGVFSPHYFAGDSLEYSISDEYGRDKFIIKINLTH